MGERVRRKGVKCDEKEAEGGEEKSEGCISHIGTPQSDSVREKVYEEKERILQNPIVCALKYTLY